MSQPIMGWCRITLYPRERPQPLRQRLSDEDVERIAAAVRGDDEDEPRPIIRRRRRRR